MRTMRIFNQAIGSMYIWSILLIAIIAVAASYSVGQFPLSLIFAVIICAIAEILVNKFYLKRDAKIPFSGMITGLIIGVVAPINAPLLAILVAGIAAILSKFLIKVKSSNVFNPAAFGMLIGLGLFSIGDSWWISSGISLFGITVILTPLLIIVAYQAKRLHLALSSMVTVIAITLIISRSVSLTSLEVALLSINYFFLFVMLIEPKTSPHKGSAQIIYGVGVMLIYYLAGVVGVPYASFAALLIGNLCYAFYRYRGNRLI